MQPRTRPPVKAGALFERRGMIRVAGQYVPLVLPAGPCEEWPTDHKDFDANVCLLGPLVFARPALDSERDLFQDGDDGLPAVLVQQVKPGVRELRVFRFATLRDIVERN